MSAPVLLCAAVVLLTLCNGLPAEKEAALNKKWLENMDNSRKFKCGPPQPRSFRSADLLKDKITTSEIVLPAFITLYRCDSQSGCCNSASESCGPVKQNRVTLHFRTTELAFKQISEYNHTKCDCLNFHNSQPKRYTEALPDDGRHSVHEDNMAAGQSGHLKMGSIALIATAVLAT